MRVEEGRSRVVIEGVRPEIDAGRFPIKRVLGEQVVVEADAFTDGHDAISCMLRYRHENTPEWSELPMEPLGNDRWRAAFAVAELGRYCYTVQAWVDHFKTWSRDLAKRVEAGQEVTVDLQIGAELVEAAAKRARGEDANRLRSAAEALRRGGDAGVQAGLAPELAALVGRHAERRFATDYARDLAVVVDPLVARYGAWYEFFPRSCAAEPGQHGSFRDAERRLPYVAAMGFDVVYLPPIHPIGQQYRKGKNNRTSAEAGDVGSPWAIGAAEGGHTSIHPQLGTLEDFRRFRERAAELGIHLALDIAFQAAPDHPYVQQHRTWFRQRPDGSIQYAENPPKKYQDIYPFDFESEDWQGLWEELRGVFFFWLEQGVRIFRVDNPHTKPFPFWEWAINEIKRAYPDAVLLAEAFTRPKVLYRLAKLGFSQSYNYFPWRNTKQELTEFFTELTRTELREYLRPSLWPNTPDILPEYLQLSGRAGFMVRVALAATLGATYGIYGPAYELCADQPIAPGKEEYLNSEKYELKQWDLTAPGSLKDYIARLNRIRHDNPALHSNERLRFHQIDNDQLIAYSKSTPDLDNIVLTVVNLDPHHAHEGRLELPLEELGLDARQTYQMHDLLGDARYLWSGPSNYIRLDPHVSPAQVFRIRRRVRTERDFDYYM
ncbi:MAG: alpha-1,4-glucan--maltose-1-phosphate maltosyltransferase [Roseiflexaceae bacterium]